MAKKRPKNRRKLQRDVTAITKSRRLLRLKKYFKDRHFEPEKFRQDDRRFWRPDKHLANYLLQDGRPVEYRLTNSKRNTRRDGTRAVISFASPKKVMVCKRRKARRVHLFRSQTIGKGKKVSKFRRRTDASEIKC